MGSKRGGEEECPANPRPPQDKEFVLTKAAEWVDVEKSERLAMDTAIMNELDVRSAATKAEAESRDVLRAMRDQVADADSNNRHTELVWDIRKLRKYALEIMKELGEEKEVREKMDDELGERLDKEKEEREEADDELDTKLEEMMKTEKEEREGADEKLKKDFTEVARHEILVREVEDKKLDEKFERLVNKEVEDRTLADDELDEKFEEKSRVEKEERVMGDAELKKDFSEVARHEIGVREKKDQDEVDERTKEVERLDKRIDELKEEEGKLEAKLRGVEYATAEGFKKEGRRRLEDDVEGREEELCRIGAENSLRYVIDMVVGESEQKARLAEIQRLEDETK